MGRGGESVRRRRRSAAAVFLILPGCLGSADPPRAFPTPEPTPRYVRTVPVGGEARIDPTGALPVSGRVLTAKGKPAPGVEVVVERDEYGLFPRLCLVGCTLRPCDMRLETVTGADGRFFAGMCKRAGRQLSLLLSPADHGADVRLPIYWKGNRTLLPVLRLWSPRVRFDPASGKVSWSRLPARGYGVLDRYEMDFLHDVDGDDLGERVWFAFIAEEPELVEPRALEDTSGEIVVRAYTKMRL
ncbi:MAG TPA: hypothetical protein VHN37_03455, partial [Actinomycetota bacterium]|nr:hypothetical protein [Actinomycetota bacterium]